LLSTVCESVMKKLKTSNPNKKSHVPSRWRQ
jgi:hypothetical protein